MKWSDSRALKAQLSRLWDRGLLLADLVDGHSRFPLRLALTTPSSSDITGRFDEVRAWASELAGTKYLRLQWQQLRHRVQGTQSLPTQAWVDDLESAVAWLDWRRELDRFQTMLSETREAAPDLLPWLRKRPLNAVALADDWSQLLTVVAWLIDHPRPGIYLRQVDLPGLHTKFIETHRGVLGELLDLALPAAAVDQSRVGASQFASRYGFRERPLRVRFRVLDPRIELMAGINCPDLALDIGSFSRLRPGTCKVFITENETNFLAFPEVAGAIVIFGAGYGWDALAAARWLDDCQLHYWGDIDTHGFAILDQLRSRFPHVRSLLMDRETLDAHVALWGTEPRPLRADLSRLTAEEAALYDVLRDDRLRPNLRLEQELVGYGWVKAAVAACTASSSTSSGPRL